MKKILLAILMMVLPNIVYATTIEISTAGTNLGIGTTSVANGLTIVGGGLALGSAYQNISAPSGGAIISGNAGLGVSSPGAQLDVVGTLRTTNFELINNNATAGYVLTSNGSLGVGTWAPASSGSGSGTVNTGNAGQAAFYSSTGTAVNGTAGIFFNGAGNVGIGTITPNHMLDIVANDTNTNLTTASLADAEIANSNSATANNFSSLDLSTEDTAGAYKAVAKFVGVATSHTVNAVSGDLAILTKNLGTTTEKMRVTGVGNVGIGSVAPGATLDIQGTIRVSNSLDVMGTTKFWNIGIGTSSPPQVLSVNGNASFNGGISSSTITDPINDWNASGSIITTTGSISSSSATTTLTVASAFGWSVGMGIDVAGAGTSGADLITSVTAISGNTFILAVAASTTVSGAVINHDDTAAINAALVSGKAVHLRAGLYNITNQLLMPISNLFYGDGALNLKDQITPQNLGTVIVDRSTTNNWLNISSGSSYVRDMSFETASGVTPTSGFAISIGNPSVRIANIVVQNISIYGSAGGIQINTHVAVSYIDNIYMITQGSSTTYCAIYNYNGAPYGDVVFNAITALPVTNDNGGYGVYVVAADVNQYQNMKINGYSDDLYINSTSVANQFFADNSFEGATTGIYIAGGTNINFSGGEIGVGNGGGSYGVDIEGGSIFSFTGMQFHDLGNGIKVNNSSGHDTFSNNTFDTITTTALNIVSNIPAVSFSGDIASGNIVNSGSAVNYFSAGNVGISSTNPGQTLDVQGTLRTTNFTLSGNGAASGYILQTSSDVGIGTWVPEPMGGGGSGTVNSGTAGQIAYYGTSTAAVNGTNNPFTLNGDIGIGTTIPAQPLDVIGTVRILNTNLATAGGSTNSDSLYLNNAIWNGSNSVSDNWQLQTIVGTGTNPTSSLTFSTLGSGGNTHRVIFDSNEAKNGSTTQDVFDVSSNDPATSALQAIFQIIPSATASQRAFGIQSVEQGTADRGLYLNPGGGNVGVGNTSASQLFGVGSASQFNVDTSGNITTSGAYTQSGSGIDKFNGNVGIGSATPGSALDVQGSVRIFGASSNRALDVEGTLNSSFFAGNVSIASVNPTTTLDVGGNVRVGGLATGANSLLAGFTNTSAVAISGNTALSLGGGLLQVGGSASITKVGFGTSNIVRDEIDANGNLGVNSVVPNGTLDVEGTLAPTVFGGILSPSLGSYQNVGIGSFSPGQTLDIQGTARVSGDFIDQSISSAATGTIICKKANGGLGQCATLVGVVCTSCT